MTLHRIPRADLEVALVQIVRGGEHIDALYEDADGWVVVTEDRIEVRPVGVTHADRLGVRTCAS